MNKIIIMFIIALEIICLYGCSKDSSGSPSNTDATESSIVTTEAINVTEISSAQEKTTEEVTVSEKEPVSYENVPTPNDAADSAHDDSIIKLEDDGVSGKVVDEDGMKKKPLITNKSLNKKYYTGDFEITVVSAQIATLSAQSEEVAEYLGIEMEREYVLFGIGIKVENTSDKDESINPNISTITTNTKEQVDSLIMVSDDVGGDYYGNVVKEGQVFFICSKSDINEINHIRWIIDGPNANGERVGESLSIEFDLIK